MAARGGGSGVGRCIRIDAAAAVFVLLWLLLWLLLTAHTRKGSCMLAQRQIPRACQLIRIILTTNIFECDQPRQILCTVTTFGHRRAAAAPNPLCLSADSHNFEN